MVENFLGVVRILKLPQLHSTKGVPHLVAPEFFYAAVVNLRMCQHHARHLRGESARDPIYVASRYKF